jgi:hypothetical protein
MRPARPPHRSFCPEGRVISHHDLERYHLGMVKDEAELAVLEEHLLWCGACVDRAEATARYVDAVRAVVAWSPNSAATSGRPPRN